MFLFKLGLGCEYGFALLVVGAGSVGFTYWMHWFGGNAHLDGNQEWISIKRPHGLQYIQSYVSLTLGLSDSQCFVRVVNVRGVVLTFIILYLHLLL